VTADISALERQRVFLLQLPAGRETIGEPGMEALGQKGVQWRLRHHFHDHSIQQFRLDPDQSEVAQLVIAGNR